MIPSKLLFLFSFILVPAFGLPSCCEPEHDSTKNQRVLDDYLDIWSGNLTLAETVFHPDVVLHSDRFPSSTGKGSDLISVTNRDEFVAFVQRSRKGWKRYTFTPIRSTGDGESVAVRWAMHGVIGSNFTLFPTPLKAGAAVTYDGTDFLVLDTCTGLVREVYITQNLLQYFHAMGLTAITV
ncbi:hypothetical protein N7533_006577 [Penicillium manginii]|uniref:uncharacterized protein n=1 Tax=Penicillium manginii TaxID=203109 RepID=UPI0025484B89|nr:uncharacterized protein N7533_006577 [Penicillium manginii]KAJ5749549.1 hypothetical protein N7533_006577 [Penicillium manginii]